MNVVLEGQSLQNTTDNLSLWECQNVALAAVAQRSVFANNLTFEASASQSELTVSINPLLVINPTSINDICPGIANFSLELSTILELFNIGYPIENSETLRYILAILLLQNKLTRSQKMQSTLRERLEIIDSLYWITEKFYEDQPGNSLKQDHTLEELAKLYQDTISAFSFRIQIKGDTSILKNIKMANRIRSLLLAGIRSAVLWYQLGERRWRLVVYRKRIYEAIGAIRHKVFVLN